MTTNRLAFDLQRRPSAAEKPPGPSSDRSMRHGRMQSITQDPVVGILVLILALAALPDRIAPPWRGDLITVASGVLAILVAGLIALRRFRLVLPLRHLAPSLILVAAVILWALFQASPLPGLFRGDAWIHPLWRLAADALPIRPAGAISLDPSAGIAALLVLLRGLAVIWIAFQLATTSRHARHLLLAVVILGAASVAGALAMRTLAPQAAGGGVSPVVAGLCLLTAITLRIGQGTDRSEPRRIVRWPVVGKLREIFTARWWSVPAMLLFATALATAGLTGLIAAFLGILSFLLAIAAAPSLAYLRHRLGFGLSLAFVIGALAAGLIAASGRINAAPPSDPAIATLPAVAAQAIADAPLLGTGYGTFASVAHLYGTPAGNRGEAGPGFYLRTLVELGVPAGIALVLACAGLFVLCANGVFLRRRNAIFPCLGIAACLLMAGDAVASTALQDPLPALIWCIIMGVACAQSLPTSERHAEAEPVG